VTLPVLLEPFVAKCGYRKDTLVQEDAKFGFIVPNR
jgi:hypothetical protein